ncbi:hypothetical protein TNCV_1486131 [Trichonephila clavipes]|nr:hypothetical protein TNCV_1486131 [Trichonephila clavipes]
MGSDDAFLLANPGSPSGCHKDLSSPGEVTRPGPFFTWMTLESSLGVRGSSTISPGREREGRRRYFERIILTWNHFVAVTTGGVAAAKMDQEVQRHSSFYQPDHIHMTGISRGPQHKDNKAMGHDRATQKRPPGHMRPAG